MDDIDETFLLSDAQQCWEFEERLHDWFYSLDEIQYDDQRQFLTVVFVNTDSLEQADAVFEQVERFYTTDENGCGDGCFSWLTVEDEAVTISGPLPATITMIVPHQKIVHVTLLTKRRACEPNS